MHLLCILQFDKSDFAMEPKNLDIFAEAIFEASENLLSDWNWFVVHVS